MEKFLAMLMSNDRKTPGGSLFCTWRNGKVFFPDKSWEDIDEGLAIVSIAYEKETFGYIKGEMIDGPLSLPTEDQLLQQIRENIREESAPGHITWEERYLVARQMGLGSVYWKNGFICTTLSDGEVFFGRGLEMFSLPESISEVNLMDSHMLRYGYNMNDIVYRTNAANGLDLATSGVVLHQVDGNFDYGDEYINDAMDMGMLTSSVSEVCGSDLLTIESDNIDNFIKLMYVKATDTEIGEMIDMLISAVNSYNKKFLIEKQKSSDTTSSFSTDSYAYIINT